MGDFPGLVSYSRLGKHYNGKYGSKKTNITSVTPQGRKRRDQFIVSHHSVSFRSLLFPVTSSLTSRDKYFFDLLIAV